MALSGYSGTPLIQKLGISKELKIVLVNAPENYFDLLESDIAEQIITNFSEANFVHVFAVNKKELADDFTKMVVTAKPDCVIWISWYKKSAKLQTDITEDVIREIVLPTGWVDVKVCAVSDIWSGLKIVKRKK